MDTATRVQILDEADCLSHCTNTLGKGMNPIILPPAISKIVGQTEFFKLGEATSLGEGKMTLCHILPERSGCVNIYIYSWRA